MRVFYWVGRLSYRLRWLLIPLWAAFLAGSFFFVPAVEERLLGGDLTAPGSDSEQVQEILNRDFSSPQATLVVVFAGDDLSAESEEFREAEREALEKLGRIPEVGEITSYQTAQNPLFVSDDGEKSYAVVGFEASESEVVNLVDRVRTEVRSEELETYVTGTQAVNQDIRELAREGVAEAETRALPLTLLILLVAFGGVVAAGLPVLVGVFSVAITLALIYFLAGALEMSVFLSNVVTMLGLGLGIDYSLFVVSRFREEIARRPVPDAVAHTVSTAGRTVFFSGSAVTIGLLGLLFFPFTIFRSIALGGFLVVLMAVAISLTLMPAVLGVLGHRVNLLSLRRRSTGTAARGGRFWRRFAELAMAHPVLMILAVGGVLAVIIYPATGVKTGLAEAKALPPEAESRAGDDILREEFDYPAINPVQVMVSPSEGATSAESLSRIEDLGKTIQDTEGVEGVTSAYTVGEEAARTYAQRVTEAQEEARQQVQERTEEVVEGRFREELQTRTDQAVEQQIEEQAQQRIEAIVEEQLAGLEAAYGTVPAGAEERIRASVEPAVERELRAAEDEIRARVEPQVEHQLEQAWEREQVEEQAAAEIQQRVDEQVPDLPEGVSADGEVTPEGVANFLDTEAARENKDLQQALGELTSGEGPGSGSGGNSGSGSSERALIRTVPIDDPDDQAAHATVERVRTLEPPEGTSVLVGGTSANQKDFISSIYTSAPYAAAFILGVTFLALTATFRSVIVSLKGIVANALSIAASLGMIVLIFQYGHLSGLLGFAALGYLDVIVLVLIFCVVFGISMDYEVFLLSRMKEAHDRGASPAESVTEGIVRTGRIITSAAAILIVVTGAFAFTDTLQVQALGLGIAVAIFVDATIIRLVLVPAVMRLLGETAWWPGTSRER